MKCVVPIIVRVRCLWCGGKIREYIKGYRNKKSSHDIPDRIYKNDYHEGCWVEAIEIVV